MECARKKGEIFHFSLNLRLRPQADGRLFVKKGSYTLAYTSMESAARRIRSARSQSAPLN